MLGSVKWTAVEKFSLQGISFILSLIMARLLTPDDYGTVGMINIFLAVSRTFIDSGFANALIRKTDRTDDDFCTVFYFNVAISVFCYLILFIIAPWVADFFDVPLLRPILRVQAVNLVINSLVQIQITKMTIDLNFKAGAKIAIISSLVSGVAGIILAYLGFGVWAIVFQGIISAAVSATCLLYYIRWRPRLVFSVTSFKSMFSYGSKLLASGLLDTVYSNLTTLVIGKFYSSEDLGYYQRGIHFTVFPVNTINGIVGRVTFPIMSKIQQDDKYLIAVYRKYISIMSMAVFFVCCLISSLAQPMILFLLTDKWAKSVIYLQVFSFAMMFDHINKINLNLLQVKGRSDLFLKLEILKKTISTIILFAAIPFGVLGICVSRVIYSQIAIIINTYYTGKLFGLGYWAQFSDFSKYLLLSVLCCLPAFALTYVGLNDLLSLILGTLISGVLYLFVLRKDPLFIELLDIISEKFPFLGVLTDKWVVRQ